MDRRSFAYTWCLAPTLWLAIACSGGAGEPRPQPVTPPPPDYAAVLATEFELALASDSNAALIAFIARHPDEALTNEARRRLDARRLPDNVAGTGPDAEIEAAFDAARLDGSSEALAHSPHALPATPWRARRRIRSGRPERPGSARR